MGGHDAQKRAAWKFVRAVIRSQSAGVVGAAIAGLLWQAGAVSAPLMVKNAVDHGVLQRDHRTLLLWLGALLGVGLLEMSAGAVRHLYAVRNRSRTDARVRDAIFAHALRLDASYHDRVGPGELMSRASSDSAWSRASAPADRCRHSFASAAGRSSTAPSTWPASMPASCPLSSSSQ